jgi:GTPase SAR1 family protein
VKADFCTGVDWIMRTVEVDGARVKLQVRDVPPCSSKHVFCESDPLVLQIWDTAGVRRFHTVTSSHYKSAHAFVIGYDITDEVSI